MTDTTHYASDTNGEGVYIPKSYQFERDMDTTSGISRHDYIEFQDESNTHFLADDVDDLVNTAEGQSVLKDMLQTFFSSQKERIDILDDYSKGNNANIKKGQRRVDGNKADYRIQHNYGGYISSFVTGYLLGKPITIEADALSDIHENNDIDALNYDLGYDASRFGRAFELHYRTEDGEDNIALVDPTEMFAIRKADVKRQLIGAVHCPIYNGYLHVTVYTDDYVYKYQPIAPEQFTFKNAERKKHNYGMVPVVEWWNNRFRTGDFEPVISQINAYDNAQSDTANYMSDLNDATLVVNVDNIDDLGGYDGVQAMGDANIFVLENGTSADGKSVQGSADYIYKQYDVQGTEKYKDRLVNDIFKLSNLPNLDDEKFGGQTSGIAIQYKLIGLKQIQVTKERYFTKALRRRYQIIANVHRSLNDTTIEPSEMTFTFHPNLPQDVWEEVDNFIQSGGELSQETLRELASFIDEKTETTRLTSEEGKALSPEERSYWSGLNENDTEQEL